MKRLLLALYLLPSLGFSQLIISPSGGGGGGSGTVTSVGATVPSFLSVAGSPVTTSGTLAITLSGTALPVANGGTGITSFGAGVATFLGTPSSANLASALTDETGSGLAVFGTSPTLVTPVLGTPTSVTLTNATGLPVSGITGSTTTALGVGSLELGHATDTTLSRASAGVLAVEGVNVLLNGGALGTPASGTLTNATGLPISTGVSGLATGAATFLGTSTSANLASLITDETGSGAAVFATSPTLVTPSVNSVGSVAGNDITINPTTPAQITTAQPGQNANYRASDAIAGSATVGGAAGGTVTITGGDAKRLTSGAAGGGAIGFNTGAGIGGGSNGAITFAIGGVQRMSLTSTGNLTFTQDNSNDIGASGTARPRDFYLGRNEIYTGLIATSAAAPTVASATTIAPVTPIVFISGTTAIATITAPSPISSGGGQITLIPTGIFTTTTAGNIALASTAVVSKALIMTYDTTTTKWYPSY